MTHFIGEDEAVDFVCVDAGLLDGLPSRLIFSPSRVLVRVFPANANCNVCTKFFPFPVNEKLGVGTLAYHATISERDSTYRDLLEAPSDDPLAVA